MELQSKRTDKISHLVVMHLEEVYVKWYGKRIYIKKGPELSDHSREKKKHRDKDTALDK